MKKTIYAIAFLTGITTMKAQTSVADFEIFTLTPNSAYSSTTSAAFETGNAVFPYKWDTQFSYWAGGFAYTNIQDSSTAGSGNLYGVKALNGYNNSGKWVVAKDRGTITLKAPFNHVEGFYITNTTYAWKSVKNGDMFSRKFGDTTGTNTGTLYAQGSYPDYFKVTAKGFYQGTMKSDSSEFYLADYRFTNNAQDYIVNTWQWMNTSNLGPVDSLQFFMYSSDIGEFGINTPLFFAIDNFTSGTVAGIRKNKAGDSIGVYPNPFTSYIHFNSKSHEKCTVNIYDISGKNIFTETGVTSSLNLGHLESGMYFAEIVSGENKIIKKLIKE